jgi:RNA-binding protein
MSAPVLSAAERRALKGRAQRLDATVRLGKQGLTDELVATLNASLAAHELVKVKLVEFKAERKDMAAQLAERTGSVLVQVVGHVVVLFRPRPAGV